MANTKDLVSEVYRTAIDLELNDEIAFQAALFVKEFMPHELEMQSYYMKEILMRFKKGSIIAYADWQARQILVETYQIVVEHGGLFGNWYNSEESV
jgi:hypothetical protein